MNFLLYLFKYILLLLDFYYNLDSNICSIAKTHENSECIVSIVFNRFLKRPIKFSTAVEKAVNNLKKAVIDIVKA